MKWIEIDISDGIVRVGDITEGDLNSAGIRVVNFPENWKDKLVNAVFYRGTDSIDVKLELNGDKDRLIGNVPTQILADDGSFKIVVYAVATNQVEEPYRDVRPAVWAEVRDGLESAEVLPLDKDVGAYLTLLIDLQNKEMSIDEMIKRLGDIEAIKTKLDGVADGAEVNVQSDWEETNEASDKFIKNKPAIDTVLSPESDNAISNSAVYAEFTAIGNALNEAQKQIGSNAEAIEQGAAITEGTSSDLISHRLNEFENENHLTNEEKTNVDKLPIIEEDLARIFSGEINVPNSDMANRALADMNGNYITDTYATKKEVNPDVITTVPTTLEPNKSYNFGTVEELSLGFPSNANDGDVIYVTFRSDGVNPTNLVVNTLNLHDEFELIPEYGEGYEIYAKYIDGGWLAKYSSYVPHDFNRLPETEEE